MLCTIVCAKVCPKIVFAQCLPLCSSQSDLPKRKKEKRPKNWKNGLASHSVKNTRFYPYTYSKGLYFQKIRQNENRNANT